MAPWHLWTVFLLDLMLGDPKGLPHPTRAMGKLIDLLETFLRKGIGPKIGERGAGILLTITVVFLAFLISGLLIFISGLIHPAMETGVTLYLAYTTLSVRSLGDEAYRVMERLLEKDLVLARRQLSHIVGRNTEQLTEAEVIRATVETVSESSSDGIVASLFFLVLGGVPLAMAYKAINTLDSMVGHKTDRYREFGWASARLDDIANFVPARITAVLMAIGATFLFGRGRAAFKIMLRDGRKHDSPNAGFPESAAAGAIGIALGGPARYGEFIKERPNLGDPIKEPGVHHIRDGILLMQTTSYIMLILCLIILHIIH